ncbi:jg27125, partial [Pararge aegeria aegeria]
NQQGDILNDKEDILERWVEHFNNLLNTPKPLAATPELDLNIDNNELPRPTLEDVERAIQRLRNNKSPGSDNIQGELIKYGGPRLHKEIHTLIDQIWSKERLPDEWKTAIISPLHKKGDVLECTNYRGISLLNVAYKIFANVLYDKLLKYTEPLLGEFQC